MSREQFDPVAAATSICDLCDVARVPLTSEQRMVIIGAATVWLQKAAQAAAVPSVWVVGTKTFSLVFRTREDADQWQKHNGMDTPASYVVPIEIPVLAFAAPKPEDGR